MSHFRTPTMLMRRNSECCHFGVLPSPWKGESRVSVRLPTQPRLTFGNREELAFELLHRAVTLARRFLDAFEVQDTDIAAAVLD